VTGGGGRTESGVREPEDGGRETGDRRQETGNGRQVGAERSEAEIRRLAEDRKISVTY